MAETIEAAAKELKNGAFDKAFGIIDLCIADDESGKRCHYVIKVKPSLYAEYKNKCYMGEEFEPEVYGDVLASGAGAPSMELIKSLSEQYGFSADFEERVTTLLNT